jgi:hypothetical protein
MKLKDTQGITPISAMLGAKFAGDTHCINMTEEKTDE